MKSLIIDLQQAAVDDSVLASTLLRKALVVATRLRQDEFKKWIESELAGFTDDLTDDLPEYRQASGQLMAWNMFRGWQPVQFEDNELNDLASKKGLTQSVLEIEYFDSNSNQQSQLQIPLPPNLQKDLSAGLGYETQFTFVLNKASINAILGSIRTIILRWSLELEGAGVRGEGMSFTEAENQASGSVPQEINHYYAPVTIQTVGTGSATSLVIGTMDIGKIGAFIDSLESKIDDLGDFEDKQELEEDIRTIKSQVNVVNPKWDKIKASLRSIGTALVKIGANVAATELLQQLAPLLQ